MARTHLDWGVSLLDRPNPRHADATGQLQAAADLGSRYGLAVVERRAGAVLAQLANSAAKAVRS